MPITREMTISTTAEMHFTRIIVQKDEEVRLAVNSGG
jgi:Fe-S cluster assembly iron-binding protein IscA